MAGTADHGNVEPSRSRPTPMAVTPSWQDMHRREEPFG